MSVDVCNPVVLGTGNRTVLTGTVTVLSINTKLHATTKVSMAFEKVCVW